MRIVNAEYRSIPIGDISFQAMPYEGYLKTLSSSATVVDINHPSQNGLTMRTLEVLFGANKLITTNESIVHYDIYHPDNVTVIDREHPVVPTSFFSTPFRALDAKIMERYSITSWLVEILDLCERDL